MKISALQRTHLVALVQGKRAAMCFESYMAHIQAGTLDPGEDTAPDIIYVAPEFLTSRGRAIGETALATQEARRATARTIRRARDAACRDLGLTRRTGGWE